MDAKLSLTTHCNARCKTCPVWEYTGKHIDVDSFKLLWTKLMLSDKVHRILLNNTGDMYIHPHRKELFDYMSSHKHKPIIMTTNAAAMDSVPAVDLLIISFNGGTKETYEFTTGLPFDKTVARIKSFYPQLKNVYCELHCLMWEGNEGTEDNLKELWQDFPGRVRLSYKYDNQMKEDKTISKYKRETRVYCDYLDMLSILPDGQVVTCAHDFAGETNLGNALTDQIDDIIFNQMRIKKQREHRDGNFSGLCADCNYNTGVDGKIVYL